MLLIIWISRHTLFTLFGFWINLSFWSSFSISWLQLFHSHMKTLWIVPKSWSTAICQISIEKHFKFLNSFQDQNGCTPQQSSLHSQMKNSTLQHTLMNGLDLFEQWSSTSRRMSPMILESYQARSKESRISLIRCLNKLKRLFRMLSTNDELNFTLKKINI